MGSLVSQCGHLPVYDIFKGLHSGAPRLQPSWLRPGMTIRPIGKHDGREPHADGAWFAPTELSKMIFFLLIPPSECGDESVYPQHASCSECAGPWAAGVNYIVQYRRTI